MRIGNKISQSVVYPQAKNNEDIIDSINFNYVIL
jgi:hypothetical protein